MTNRLLTSIAVAAMASMPLIAFSADGGISSEMMARLKAGYDRSASTRALRNAISANAIDKLATNPDAKNGFDTHFSHRVPSKGITDQQRSGRCWLFTGLNVLRSQMMAKNGLPELKLSQNYNFFFDQLEKANLFLQGISATGDNTPGYPTI